MPRLLTLCAGFLFILALASCRNESWHQKLTLVVETPQGDVVGSAVVAINGDMRQLPGSSNEIHYTVRGEAVVVEVLPGKYLFALLGDPSEQFYWAARERFKGLDRAEWLPLIPKQTEPVDLFPDQMMMLVTFDDVTKPESVKLVDPNDLAASFGPGVALKVATLEITSEPVSQGRVEGVLGWLCDHITQYRRLSGKSGPIADNLLANNLGPGDFKIGECK